ncbi:MAG: aminotransferase DegT [Crocinitomicaceae bacterium]|nr:aminotransferase DegT [Crocinitomicaceae bacterium]
MKPINVTKSFLPPVEEYQKQLKKIWKSGQITNRGELVKELEEKIQLFLGSKAIPLAVCNGTVALQVAIKSLALNGEIITTPFSYVATTSSIVWEGCKPVFVDINPDYLTIDETKIEAAITKKTSAIIATHVYGNPCNVEEIEKIAKKFNLKVIYDAAHCFGVKYNNKSIFDYGDISTCSFHATKLFHTGEGGAIFCNNEELKASIFLKHNFGHISKTSFNGVGINAKLSELNAAMGLAILPYFNEILTKRKEVFDYYIKRLTKVRTLKLRDKTKFNYSYFPILLSSEEKLLLTQENLEKHKIFPRRYFYPSLNTLPYIEKNKMKISEDISKRILCLPVYYNLNKANQNKVIRHLI